MSDSFETLVIQRLDELREDNKLFLKKLDDHGKDDIVRFESLDKQLAEAATTAAEAKGVAKATAKIWGVITGSATTIGGAAWAIFKLIHHVK